jgi:hypothetical protein
MQAHIETKTVSRLMDELLECVPDGITSQTALDSRLVTQVYDTAKQIKSLRNPLAEETWQAEIAKKLEDAKVSPDQLRNLTYCVMYALDAKEMEPLVRSANSTFANVLLRQCAVAFKQDLNELKPLLQLVYYSLDSQPKIPGSNNDSGQATANVLKFSIGLNVDKAQIQSLALIGHADRKAAVTETKELPATKIAKFDCQAELKAYQETLMVQAAVAAKAATSIFPFFNKKQEQVPADFKRELPIVVACLKYLSSNDANDKDAFMSLYTRGKLSASFRTKMDKFFELEHNIQLAASASSPKSNH